MVLYGKIIWRGDIVKKKLKGCLFFMLCLVLLTGCNEKLGTLHTREEIIDYVDNLTDGENHSRNLKGKYTVIDEKVANDVLGEYRDLTLKLNDYGLVFKAKSAYECSQEFSASCVEHTYTITTDFFSVSWEYFYDSFLKENNIEESNLYDETKNTFVIDSIDDIAIVADYLHKYLNYINKIENNSGINFSFQDRPIHFFIDSSNKGRIDGWIWMDKQYDNGLYYFDRPTNLSLKIENNDVEKTINDIIKGLDIQF